jgi:glycosyltransferase involved in cell wall biosynthesis
MVDGSTNRSMTLAQPLVTAVLVCWNHRKYVRSAIESVFQQTYRNLQVIVFDNGSTDGSQGELEALAAQYSFKLVLQENIGLVRTLNLGLQMAEGEYFAVLSTDDIWLHEKIKKQVAYMTEHPNVHMTFGAMNTIDAKGNEVESSSSKRAFVSGEVKFDDYLKRPMSPNGPTIMCRTQTLRAIGGYDERIRIEDAALLLAMTSKGYGVYGLPDCLTSYRRHETNWTSQHTTWPDVCALGKKYCRSRREYKNYVRSRLRAEFRWLASNRKSDAIHLALNEPLGWNWTDMAVGYIKLLVPSALLGKS